jgi:cell division protein FtsQ
MIEGSWLGRGRRRRRVLALRRTRSLVLRPRVLLGLTAVVVVLAGGWLWLRDSSLVAVKRVTVIGVQGPDAGRIRSALRTAALNMTTLDVHTDTLNMAVQPYPVVKGLQVSTQFPHRLTIRVVEQVPVAALSFDGRRIAVAGDGTLLHDVSASASLPQIAVRVAPGGSRVSDRVTSHEVAVLAAAPYVLLGRVSQVTATSTHGLVAQLRDGPSIYFGSAGRLHEKWAAAAAVLADGGSVGALYIDVTDPQRPAAGSGSSSASASASTAGSTSATPSSSAAVAPSSITAPSAAGTSTTSAAPVSSGAGATPPAAAGTASSGASSTAGAVP